MSSTGLILSSTSQATAEQWGRRQPDWVLVSQRHKRIAIVDLCRPSDVHPAQLLAAAMRKQQTYLPLLEALRYYSDQGWTIHVFPWVVGIRGMIDPSHVHSLLKFLEIPNQHWKTAVDRTVLASVRAFYFLHRVRFGGLPETVRPDLDPDHSAEDSDDEEGGKRTKRNPHWSAVGAPPACTDSDSPGTDGIEAVTRTLKKARRPSATRGVGTLIAGAAASPSAPSAVGGLTPPLHLRTSSAARGLQRLGVARQSNIRKSNAHARLVIRTMPLAAPTRCAEPPRPSGRQRPKRKRWERTSATDAPDPADAAQRPVKRPQRANPGAPPAVLWDRWRQMEPRRNRRT